MFIKSIVTLMTGGVIANIISVISIPVISRLFSPDDFGALTLFFSITSVLMIIFTLRYEHAIVLPESDVEAEHLFLLSTYLLFMLTVVSFLFILFVYFFFNQLAWVKILGVWFLFLPLGAFFLSLENIAVSYNTRLKKYSHIAVSGVTQVSIASGSRIGLGALFGSSIDFLILGQLFGSISRIYILLKHTYQNVTLNIPLFDVKRSIYLIKKYIQFPLYSLPTGLLRSSAQALPVFALAFMFSPLVVGLYGMAIRLANLPISLLGESIRRIYLQKAAVMHNESINLTQSLTKLTAGLITMGLFIYIPLYLWGGVTFVFILGEKWGEAGQYISILSPWFFALFVQSAAAVVYVVLQRQDVLFKIQIISVIFMIIMFLVSYFEQLESEQLLLGISILGVVTNTIIIIIAYRLTMSDR